jgi:hypothetical protein
MPAIGQISILDAKGTPVAHVFDPVTTDGAVGQLANRAATIPQGFEKLTLELKPPSSPTAAYRLIGKFVFPTVATVDGVDTVTRSSSAEFTFNFSQLSSSQDRKDYLKLMQNLCGHATVVTMATNLEPLY